VQLNADRLSVNKSIIFSTKHWPEMKGKQAGQFKNAPKITLTHRTEKSNKKKVTRCRYIWNCWVEYASDN